MEDAGCTLMTGNHSHRVNHPNANSWQFESPPALAFSKIACQVYIITIVPCSRCDFAMSSGERNSLNLGFPYLRYVPVRHNISAMAGQNLMKNSHHGDTTVEIPIMMPE